MRRSNLNNAGAEFWVNRLIGYHQNPNRLFLRRLIGGESIINRFNFQFLADIGMITLIIRMDCQSSVAQFGFRPGGSQSERTVFDEIKFPFFRDIIHF